MKKTTIISVMAVLCLKKLKAESPKLKAKTLRNTFKLEAKNQKQTPRNLNKSYPAIKAFSMLLLIFGLFIPTVWAQNAPVKPLMVGDKVPASFWEQKHTIYQDGKTTTQTLAAYKGKLLILDFWATWCGSCIKKFPLIDSLQQVYKADLKTVLVNTISTQDTADKIGVTLALYAPNLPTIIGDTILKTLFPQKVLPHYVWIDSGLVTAITGGTFYKTQNVADIISHRKAINTIILKRKNKDNEK